MFEQEIKILLSGKKSEKRLNYIFIKRSGKMDF
jgi:hypothetical protein